MKHHLWVNKRKVGGWGDFDRVDRRDWEAGSRPIEMLAK